MDPEPYKINAGWDLAGTETAGFPTLARLPNQGSHPRLERNNRPAGRV